MRGVAVFDLDGTLTRRDTSVPFFRFLAGGGATVRAVAGLAWTALPDLARAWREERGPDPLGGVLGRWEGWAHRRLVAALVAGRTVEDLDAAGRAFARSILDDGLRPDAAGRLEEHRQAGHRVLLASASLEVYAAPLGELLGCDGVVGTRLHLRDGIATGGLDGLHCWGEEKLRRVRAVLAPGEEIRWAYGDSRGDRALLEAAGRAVG